MKRLLSLLLAVLMLVTIVAPGFAEEGKDVPVIEATAAPTAVPTAAPTPEPTAVPTAVPTAEPTSAPTAVPTPEPTPVPTAVPTPEPTPVPTAVPTPEPTAIPTAVPTPEPTPVQTAVPTPEPTPVPTAVPTPEPTPIPTAVPTVAPTAAPTAEPTQEPTAVPTAAPTAEPTALPTAVPTPEVTTASTPSPAVETTPAPETIPTTANTAEPSTPPAVGQAEDTTPDLEDVADAEATAEPTPVPSVEPESTLVPEVMPDVQGEPFRTGLAYISANTRLYQDKKCRRLLGTLNVKSVVYVLECVSQTGSNVLLSSADVLKLMGNIDGVLTEVYAKYERVTYLTDSQESAYRSAQHAASIEYKKIKLEPLPVQLAVALEDQQSSTIEGDEQKNAENTEDNTDEPVGEETVPEADNHVIETETDMDIEDVGEQEQADTDYPEAELSPADNTVLTDVDPVMNEEEAIEEHTVKVTSPAQTVSAVVNVSTATIEATDDPEPVLKDDPETLTTQLQRNETAVSSSRDDTMEASSQESYAVTQADETNLTSAEETDVEADAKETLSVESAAADMAVMTLLAEEPVAVMAAAATATTATSIPTGSKTNYSDDIWKMLRSWGFSQAQAAGIMGNIKAESAYSPYNAQDSYGYAGADDRTKYVFSVSDGVGFGLCQWTLQSRKQGLLDYANSCGSSVWDFDTQMGFLKKELESTTYAGKSLMNYLKGCSDIRSVTERFMITFEKPANQSSSAKATRCGYARATYNYYLKSAGIKVLTSMSLDTAYQTFGVDMRNLSFLPTVKVGPSDATEQGYLWSTSDSSVATVVASSGVVVGRKPGTATITVTAKDVGKVSASYLVTIVGRAQIKLNDSLKTENSLTNWSAGTDMTITWSAEKADRYRYKVIVLTAAPNASSNQTASAVATIVNESNPVSTGSYTISASKLAEYAKQGRYLKIAVQALNAQDTEHGPWSWIGVELPDISAEPCKLAVSPTAVWKPAYGGTSKTYTLTGDGDYEIGLDMPGQEGRPVAKGYVSNWLSYSLNGNKLVVTASRNYAKVTRTGTVTVRCKTHGQSVSFTVTQAANSTNVPSATLTLDKTTYAPGETVTATVKYKNAQRIYISNTVSGISAINEDVTLTTTQKTVKYTFTIPATAKEGTYKANMSVSNSNIQSDSWAQGVTDSVEYKVEIPSNCSLSISPTAVWKPVYGGASKTYTLVLDSGCNIELSTPGSDERPTSKGYVSNWLSYTLDGNKLIVTAAPNYAKVTRTGTVAVRCKLHGNEQTVTVTQAANKTNVPSATLTLDKNTYAPGDTVTATVKYKYVQRIYISTSAPGVLAINEDVALSSSQKTVRYTFTIPTTVKAGTYTANLSASNSNIKSDSWAQGVSASAEYTVTGATVSAPQFLSTPTATGGTYGGDTYTVTCETSPDVAYVAVCYKSGGNTIVKDQFSATASGVTVTKSSTKWTWKFSYPFQYTGDADTRTVLLRCYNSAGQFAETESKAFTCKKKEEADSQFSIKHGSDVVLAQGSTSGTFECASSAGSGSNATLTVTSTYTWTVTASDTSWMTVKKSGSNAIITIGSVDDGKSYTSTLTFTSNNAKYTVKVTLDKPASGGTPTFTGSFTNSTKTLTIGESWTVEAKVSVSGGSGALGWVSIDCDSLGSTLKDNFKDHSTTSVETKYWGAYTIDTTKAPWNTPGTYKLELWAKDTNDVGGTAALASMTVVIVKKESASYTINASASLESKFAVLQQAFPSGMYWNHNLDGEKEIKITYNGVTSTTTITTSSCPSSHHSELKSTTGATCNYWIDEAQCIGFARFLAWCITGKKVAASGNWKTDSSLLDNIAAGDLIWVTSSSDYGHKYMVTAVNGENITYVDCNGGTSLCQIQWGRTTTLSTIRAKFKRILPYSSYK